MAAAGLVVNDHMLHNKQSRPPSSQSHLALLRLRFIHVDKEARS